MTTPKQPKDRLPKGGMVSQSMRTAVKTQAANVLQKGILDMLYGKVLTINGFVRQERAERNMLVSRDGHAPPEISQNTLDGIGTILAMTRDEVKELQASGMVDFPDEAIQAIVAKAVDDITNVLLEDK